MELDFGYIEGQTPLDEDEKQGLRIKTIATLDELDEYEQQNIEKAVLWTIGRSFKPGVVFIEAFLRNLHKRMFGDIWNRTGEFRKTNKNIGVDKWEIPTKLRMLLNDARFWLKNGV